MNKENKDWLSALADGELHGAELQRAVDALREDDELKQSWKAYHIVRDAVTSNLHGTSELQLHERVSEALRNEATVLAPPGRHKRPWLKQVAGLAIAASVTGVAIIGVQNINGVDTAPSVSTVAEKQEYIRIDPVVLARSKEEMKADNDELDAYLVNHNEYSSNSGIHGVLPYVRIVGHKSGQ